MTQENTTQNEKSNIFSGGGGTTCLRYMEKGVECGNPRNRVRTEKN